MAFDVGSKVYFQHPEHSWVLGTVTDVTSGAYGCVGNILEGDSEFSARNLKADNIHHFVEGSEVVVDDLLQLPYLHDSTLLDQVRRRYFRQTMFTHIGTILLSLNPFDSTIPRYQSTHMKRFFAGKDKAGDISDIGPSLWALAQNAYEWLRDGKGNQSVLVSGESGAGKTEAVKIIVQYLAATSSQNNPDTNNVAEKVVQTSPILESFGNAKTLRNDNSSRFGKFMKLYFAPEKAFAICGCAVETYLLEKSRIVTHAKGERGYHVFYQLLAGNHPQAARWRLKPGGYRATLGQGGTITFTSPKNDNAEWNEMLEAMNIIGMTNDEQLSCFDVLAAILHLMESVTYTEKNLANQDPCAAVTDPNALLTIEFLCTSLLGITSPDAFLRELTSVTHQVGGETVVKLYSKAQALDVKDSICKFLYEATFHWLVKKINVVTRPDPATYDMETTPWIGLLDIFGFEQFTVNSLEQLCINLANEVIQCFYNQKVFVADMEECKAEGIDVSAISYSDNNACVDMISGKGGILALLDEECTLQTGTDQSFLQKVVDKKSNSVNFVRPRTEPNCFIVHHYAGGVKYTVNGFRDKNVDSVKQSLIDIFQKGSHIVLKTIKLEQIKSTTSKTFRTQLTKLLTTISATTPHWVRTIKPHPSRRPKAFHGSEVMAQLRCSGVLDTVRIRKLGYAVRMLIPEFERTFRLIGGLSQVPNYKSDAQIGHTKVFMRFNVYSDLLVKRTAHFAKLVTSVQRYAKARKSNYIVACKSRIPKLVMVQSAFLRYIVSRKEYRGREAIMMRDVWIKAARELAQLQNDERKIRESYEQEVTLVQEAIVVSMHESLLAVEKMWHENKPQRDAAAVAVFIRAETAARKEIPSSEDVALVLILRMMRDDFDHAFTAQIRRVEMIAAAVSRIEREEEDGRKQVVRDELEEQKRCAQLLWQAAQRVRRYRENEARQEEDRLQQYLDTLRERSEALLVLKENECGVMRAAHVAPVTRTHISSPGAHHQHLYQSPTFSRLAGATNPTNLARGSSGTPTRSSAGGSPQRRTTTPGRTTPTAKVIPSKADPSHTHSVSNIASLQQMARRAVKGKGLPHSYLPH